jgi:hypothetical protein
MPDFHVMPSPDARWEVRAAEGGEILSRHEKREEAEISAEQLAREQGGGEVRIHEANGTVAERRPVE